MNSNNLRVLLIFVVASVILVVAVSFNARGYQDSWILDDVTVVTIVFILAFSVFASVCDDNRLLAIGCASFIVLLNAIPNLKYELFTNPFDSMAHYGYIRNLMFLGHIPNNGIVAATYQDFPGMHIFTGSLSIISGLSISATIKLVTSTIAGIIPLMTYVATKRVFEPSIQRFIIVGSGLPTSVSYVLTGTSFAVPFYFSIICLILVSLVAENKRQHTLVLLIFVFGLLFSHAITTLFVILFLGIVALLLKLLAIKENWFSKSYTHVLTAALVILTVSFAARLTFGNGTVLDIFSRATESFLTGPKSGIVPATFFAVPFSAKVVFFALTYAMDAVITLLSCAGVIVLFLKLRREYREAYKRFYAFLLCLMSAILGLLTLQFLSGFSSIEYERLIAYAIVLSPFLIGLFLWNIHGYFSRHRIGSAVVVLLLFSCISVSMIQLFPYQPIAPTANVLSTNLPTNEYVYDFRTVNTVYQESMILFAQSFSTKTTTVASDTVTRWQIYGFANDAFINRTLYYSPLNNQNLDWNLFLLHYDGKAGSLNEVVENRTSGILTGLKNNLGNVVYDNGESFIIAR